MGKKISIRECVQYAICLLFGILFAYAATGKLLDLEGFRDQLVQSLFPRPYANLTAILVPMLEYILAVTLQWDRYRFRALCASLFLIVLFTGHLITVLNFSDSIPCSCGGLFPSIGWTAHIKLNTGLMILALLGILWGRHHSKKRTNRYTT